MPDFIKGGYYYSSSMGIETPEDQAEGEEEEGMTEIRRMSISKFKRECRRGMELPVIVTCDDEDVFAVVEVTRLGDSTAAWHGGVSVAPPERPAWTPPDLAVDT